MLRKVMKLLSVVSFAALVGIGCGAAVGSEVPQPATQPTLADQQATAPSLGCPCEGGKGCACMKGGSCPCAQGSGKCACAQTHRCACGPSCTCRHHG